jgi:hypothetical protein
LRVGRLDVLDLRADTEIGRREGLSRDELQGLVLGEREGIIDLFGIVLTGRIRRNDECETSQAVRAHVPQGDVRDIVGTGVCRKHEAARWWVRSRRKAICERSPRDQRKDCHALGRQAGTDDYCRALRDNLICELDRDLRTRRIVGNDELYGATFDPAGCVDQSLDDLQTLLLGCTDESALPRKRKDGIEFNRILLGGKRERTGEDGRSEQRSKPAQNGERSIPRYTATFKRARKHRFSPTGRRVRLRRG